VGFRFVEARWQLVTILFSPILLVFVCDLVLARRLLKKNKYSSIAFLIGWFPLTSRPNWSLRWSVKCDDDDDYNFMPGAPSAALYSFICYQSRIMESKGSSLVEIRRVSNLVSSCIYGVFVYVFVYVNLIFMSACVLLIFRSIYASQGSTKLTAIAAIHM